MVDTALLRKEFISLAKRRQRPGAGSAPAFLRERTAQMQFPNLTQVLSPIPWAVVSGVATRMYMPERFTQDLDIAIMVEDASQARRRLAEAGYVHQGELSTGGSSWRSPQGVAVDVLEVREPWFSQALAQAQDNCDAQGLPVLPLTYLALMKFQAGRVQDLADVTRMLGQASQETLDSVRRLFVQYLPADLEDLESLIQLGQLEMGPFEPGGEA
ncbi:MAG: nucleotidyltransferase family protein [SAR202 cluster bacterium]|nr:nucleotidyltransferase family protein [SAR202 cluster bacterium]